MKRTRHALICLLLLLPLMQQAGLTHALTHLGAPVPQRCVDVSPPSSCDPASDTGAAHCLTCAAFAAALAAPPPFFGALCHALTGDFFLSAASARALPAAEFSCYAARAPPAAS